MYRVAIAIAMIVLAAGAPQAGHAVAEVNSPTSALSQADVECIVVALNMMNNDDPKVKAAALSGFLYYIGRIDGREPEFDLEHAVIAEVHRTEGKPLTGAVRCGQVMQARGRQIVSLGQRLKAVAEEENKTKSGAAP
jgi:hypothetical protein